MTHKEIQKIFCENLQLLNKNLQWLKKSFQRAKGIKLESKKILSENDLEILETLSNRFGRTVDILINKVLRSLDILELEDVTRRLDIVIRAEKRGVVDDYTLLIEMKDLRNELVHEYIQENLIEKFDQMRIAFILRFAFLESASFVSSVFYLLTGDYMFLILALMVIFLFFISKLNREKIIAYMDLSNNEIQILSNPDAIISTKK
ncbi:MAG: hypothetical protein L3J74_18870 [Bacteroidales bacterium]|nr:hypothetical protein [Bacteroidales bacterium]